MIVACMMKRDGEIRWAEFPEGEWMPAWKVCQDSSLVEKTFTGLTLKEITADVNDYLSIRPILNGVSI